MPRSQASYLSSSTGRRRLRAASWHVCCRRSSATCRWRPTRSRIHRYSPSATLRKASGRRSSVIEAFSIEPADSNGIVAVITLTWRFSNTNIPTFYFESAHNCHHPSRDKTCSYIRLSITVTQAGAAAIAKPGYLIRLAGQACYEPTAVGPETRSPHARRPRLMIPKTRVFPPQPSPGLNPPRRRVPASA